MSMAADLMLQEWLIKLNDEGLAKSLEDRNIRYNGKRPTAEEFKQILRSNLDSKFVQTLSEIFTGNVQ